MAPHPNQPGQEHVLTRANAPSWLTPGFGRQIQESTERITGTLTKLSADWAKQSAAESAMAASEHLQQFSGVMSSKELEALAGAMSPTWIRDLTKTLEVMNPAPSIRRLYADQAALVIPAAPKPTPVATKETAQRGPKPQTRAQVMAKYRSGIRRSLIDKEQGQIFAKDVMDAMGITSTPFHKAQRDHRFRWREIECEIREESNQLWPESK